MFDKSFATHTLGLELDRTSLKGVALTCSRRSIKLDSSFELPIEQTDAADQNVKPLYTSEQQQHVQLMIKKSLVVTSMPAQDVLMRPLRLKVKKEKQIDAVLAFQAEPVLPYPVENALLDKIVLEKDKEGAEISLFAVRKDHLSEEIKTWNSLEIEPEVVTAAPAALALFAKTVTTVTTPFVAIYLGYAQAFCILMDQGKLAASQALPFTMESIAAALAADEGGTSSEVRAKMSDPAFTLPPLENTLSLNSAADALKIAISRILYALSKQLKGREIEAVLFFGELPNGLKEYLSTALNKPLLPLNESKELGMSSRELEKFALCIGEALSALPGNKEQLNFRQHEFQFPDPWKRLKQPVLLYLLLCMGIACSLIFYSQAEVHYEEGSVRLHYLELLQLMNKPYAHFEKEYLAKTSPEKEGHPDEVQPVEALSTEQIKHRLAFLEKELQSTPQIYPLQPNTPLVSDLLAWIATHPSFKGTEGAPGLQIENFIYSVIKRPEPTKKQEKYQIKVEMEFSSPTPKIAREFHDALIAPNEIVDPKGEIKWSSNRDRYRTSFYLKDRTLYPNP